MSWIEAIVVAGGTLQLPYRRKRIRTYRAVSTSHGRGTQGGITQGENVSKAFLVGDDAGACVKVFASLARSETGCTYLEGVLSCSTSM